MYQKIRNALIAAGCTFFLSFSACNDDGLTAEAMSETWRKMTSPNELLIRDACAGNLIDGFPGSGEVKRRSICILNPEVSTEECRYEMDRAAPILANKRTLMPEDGSGSCGISKLPFMGGEIIGCTYCEWTVQKK